MHVKIPAAGKDYGSIQKVETIVLYQPDVETLALYQPNLSGQ